MQVGPEEDDRTEDGTDCKPRPWGAQEEEVIQSFFFICLVINTGILKT